MIGKFKSYYDYYKTVVVSKYKFNKIARLIGVSLVDRLTHDFEYLNPKVAKKLVSYLYDSDGNKRSYYEVDLDYLMYSSDIESKSKHNMAYWRANHISVVDERYMKIYLADNYSKSGMSMRKLLIRNRDNLMYYEKDEPPTYSQQVNKAISDFMIKRNIRN